MSGAAILAAAVAVTKVLGALYKIPLGNLLDKEGMAHFYVAYNIYNLLVILSTAGLPLALSRLVSRAHALGRENQARRVPRGAGDVPVHRPCVQRCNAAVSPAAGGAAPRHTGGRGYSSAVTQCAVRVPLGCHSRLYPRTG